MMQSQAFQVQVEAAEALAEWKALFAEQVALQAKELAKNANPPCLITLDHYRQAAVIAAQALVAAVQNMGANDDCQEAA